MRRRVVQQFHRPHGLLGTVAGWIMTYRSRNRTRNAWTVDLLDIRPGDRVLEVGFGPGLAIDRAAEHATSGYVAGVDHSPVMLRQASRRNRKAIAAGRVDLRLGSAGDLPDFGAPFDKLFAVNVLHFDGAPLETLTGWRQQLRPGGTVAIAFQPPGPGATDEDALAAGRKLLVALEQAGFENARLKRLPMPGAMAVCAMAERPGTT